MPLVLFRRSYSKRIVAMPHQLILSVAPEYLRAWIAIVLRVCVALVVPRATRIAMLTMVAQGETSSPRLVRSI